MKTGNLYKSNHSVLSPGTKKYTTSSNYNKFWKYARSSPVVDLSTGISYVNRTIYNCYSTNQTNTMAWDFPVIMTKFSSLTTLEMFIKTLSFFESKYSPPSVINSTNLSNPPQCFNVVTDTCKGSPVVLDNQDKHEVFNLENQAYSNLTNMCASFTSFVKYGLTYYKNEYCAKCHLGFKDNLTQVDSFSKIPIGSSNIRISQKDTDLTLVYDFGKQDEIHDLHEYGS